MLGDRILSLLHVVTSVCYREVQFEAKNPYSSVTLVFPLIYLKSHPTWCSKVSAVRFTYPFKEPTLHNVSTGTLTKQDLLDPWYHI
jgi:hypothetical protein